MSSAETIKVTVETVMTDGRSSVLTFDMDPFRFKMSQDREVRPVYDLELWNFGKPVKMEVDPHRRGTRLLINGFIKAGKAKKWP